MDQSGAASASDPVDRDCPGAGRCELVPLAEVVVVGRLTVPWVPLTDWRSPGGDWAVAGGSSSHDVAAAAAGCTLAAPRISLGLTIWGRSDAAAERAAQVGPWRVAGLLLSLLLLLLLLALGLVVVPAVLGPPTLRASSSPSTLLEPVTDLPLGRLTLGELSLSSHQDPSSAQFSAPSAPSCGEKGGV